MQSKLFKRLQLILFLASMFFCPAYTSAQEQQQSDGLGQIVSLDFDKNFGKELAKATLKIALFYGAIGMAGGFILYYFLQRRRKK